MRHRDIIDVHQPSKPFFDAVSGDAEEAIGILIRKGAISEAWTYQRQLIAALDALAGETLGKSWRKAVRSQFRDPVAATGWKARALNLNASDPHMSIALASMAPMKVGDTWWLAVPLPIPCPMGPKFDEPEEIVLINPDSGAARLHSDDAPRLVEPIYTDRFTVHADARIWAREIAAHAVEWFYGGIQARKVANIPPQWTGYPRSALAVGDMTKILWPQVTVITAGSGINATQLKKVIFRQAHIAHVESPLHIARAA